MRGAGSTVVDVGRVPQPWLTKHAGSKVQKVGGSPGRVGTRRRVGGGQGTQAFGSTLGLLSDVLTG